MVCNKVLCLDYYFCCCCIWFRRDGVYLIVVNSVYLNVENGECYANPIQCTQKCYNEETFGINGITFVCFFFF